jgi:hypothetical protein
MPFDQAESQRKIDVTVSVRSPLHTTAVLEQEGRAVAPPAPMTIPQGTRGRVVNALKGGYGKWLVVIRFDLHGQSVLDWFNEETYRETLDEQ